MSGHSKWSTIKRAKASNDAKRGQLFTKLSKEIIVAAKNGGANLDSNFRLRMAVQKAKDNNMPSDNIDRAIKRAVGDGSNSDMEEIVYEGYGPGGAAIFLEAMTDNKNRTVSEIRAALGKAGGNLGENGCVAWMFEQKGLITVKKESKDEDELMELAIDAGADDMQTVDGYYEITTAVESFESVRTTLEESSITIETSEVTRIPANMVAVDEKKGKALLKLMDILDDHEDIQKAYSNFDIPDDVMTTILKGN